MKTIDLSKLELELLDGTIAVHDLSKDLAQAIFQNTQKIDEHTFSLELFKNPIIELTEENKKIVTEYTGRYFKAFVQVAVNKLML